MQEINFKEFFTVIEEYLDLGHAEIVSVADLQKPSRDVFYLAHAHCQEEVEYYNQDLSCFWCFCQVERWYITEWKAPCRINCSLSSPGYAVEI